MPFNGKRSFKSRPSFEDGIARDDPPRRDTQTKAWRKIFELMSEEGSYVMIMKKVEIK
jgi:hypothetical protein